MNICSVKIISVSLIAILVSFLAGCATFQGDDTPEVNKFSDKSAFKNRPSICINAKKMAGALDSPTPPAEDINGTSLFRGVVDTVTRESGLFGRYSTDPFTCKDMNYTLKMELLNHGNTGAAMAAGFLTGFTFGVIPSAATDNYRLTAKLIDHNGNVIKSYQVDDHVTTWIGIWFIPFMGSSPTTVIPKVWGNMVKMVYKKIDDENVLPYAQAPIEENLLALSMK